MHVRHGQGIQFLTYGTNEIVVHVPQPGVFVGSLSTQPQQREGKRFSWLFFEVHMMVLEGS